MGKVMGHTVSSKGIDVVKAKVESISKIPIPTMVKKICSFLWHVGLLRILVTLLDLVFTFLIKMCSFNEH